LASVVASAVMGVVSVFVQFSRCGKWVVICLVQGKFCGDVGDISCSVHEHSMARFGHRCAICQSCRVQRGTFCNQMVQWQQSGGSCQQEIGGRLLSVGCREGSKELLVLVVPFGEWFCLWQVWAIVVPSIGILWQVCLGTFYSQNNQWHCPGGGCDQEAGIG